MESHQFEIHPLAAKEAQAARRWYAKRSPNTAVHGTRFYRIPRYPYLVVYLESH